MNKVFKFSLLLIILFVACGKAKSPTGGPQDKEALKIISIFPDNYASISDKKIEITFNKEVDKRSAQNAFRFYPPLESFDIISDDREISLVINEELLKNRNYYLTISNLLKDTRNNSLDSNTTYTFSNGKLQDSRLFGQVIYAKDEDRAEDKKLILLDQDSVTVFIKTFSGHNYDIDGLEYRPYILRSFIDKNNNGRYDIEKEPYFRKYIDSLKTSKSDIVLAYVDTSRVLTQRANALNNQLVEVSLSEDLASWDSLSIINIADSSSFSFSHAFSQEDKFFIITSLQDTLDYRLAIFNLLDYNNNLTPVSRINFKGSSHIDTLNFKILDSFPANGSTVNDSFPEIYVKFDKIVMGQDIKASLKENETNKLIDFDIIGSKTFSAKFKPQKKLKNFNSYTFTISSESKDFLGNNLDQDFQINFMVTGNNQ